MGIDLIGAVQTLDALAQLRAQETARGIGDSLEYLCVLCGYVLPDLRYAPIKAICHRTVEAGLSSGDAKGNDILPGRKAVQ